MTKTYAIGIDIGGTNTKIGLIDNQGVVVNSLKVPTESELPFESYLDRIEGELNKLTKTLQSPILGIGIGAPCTSGINGVMENPPNLKWGTTPIRDLFSKKFKLPIIVENDANIAALGEGKWGVAKGLKDFIVVTIGTGIGTGIIINGELLRGQSGFAGEGGHITINPKGRTCHCGGIGHLEAYCSVSAIKFTYENLFQQKIGFREMVANYEQGDVKAKRTIEQTADYLGQGLAIMTALFLPEMFILAGGGSTIGDTLATMTEASLNRYVFPIMKNKVPVKISSISTSDGAILGAASLVFDHFDKNR